MDKDKKNRRQSLGRRIIQSERFLDASGALTARHVRTVFATSKIIRDPENTDAALLAQHPFILAMWHGEFLMLPMIRPKTMPLTNMVARHGDAEILGRALLRLDMSLIRGAGAGAKGKDRGGAAALRGSLKALKNNVTVAMTADVPPGPARVAGLGIVTLARLSGRPILPLAAATNRFFTLATWSRFTINLPFSKLALVAGEPILVPRDADAETLEIYRQQVERELNAVTERAYALVGCDARKTMPYAPGALSAARPGLLLNAYRSLTAAARPASGMILRRRAAQGKELSERLHERRGEAHVNRPAGALWWFHAASVGETNAVLPLIEALKAKYPYLNILLTTVTVTSARMVAARLPDGVIHQFIPLDTPVFMRRFLMHWQPDLALLTESEIWPNLILEASAASVPLVLLNARMSLRSFQRWSRLKSLSRPLFSRFDLVLAQDRKIAKRLQGLGARRVFPAGNLKYDTPAPPVNENALRGLQAAIGARPVFLAASTHPGEDEAIAKVHAALKGTFPALLTVIAPRHPARGESIMNLLHGEGLQASRRSTGEAITSGTDIYLADTIGELGLFYSLSPWAFIGGSLVHHGGQNPLEAIKLGTGVLSGPHVFNFAETYRILARAEACRFVHGVDELAVSLAELFENQALASQMKARARQATGELGGAMEKSLDALSAYLPGNKAEHHGGFVRLPEKAGYAA